MRNTMVLAAAVLCLSSAACPALDIGIGAGYRYHLGVMTDFAAYERLQEHAGSLDLRAWPYPLQLGIGISRSIIGIAPAGFSFVDAVLTADYWLLDVPLGSLPLSLHVGAGVWASLPALGLGIRGPLGLRWMPLPADHGLEVSLEVVPGLGAYVAPWLGCVAGVSAEVRARYWFGR